MAVTTSMQMLIKLVTLFLQLMEVKGREHTRQPDQTYAVVDKARKRKYNSDETNKKKFVINYGNS